MNEDTIIEFDPPLLVREDVIPGGMLVGSATVDGATSNDDTWVIRIHGDGRVIGIPVVDGTPKEDLRQALE
jgi:hypothetical protein